MYLKRDTENFKIAVSNARKRMKSWCGKDNPKWKGGTIFRRGYRFIWVPNHPMASTTGYVCEHRLVMEKHLQRFLKRGEVVHHINGNKIDNRFENLQLFHSAGKHVVLEHAIRNEKGQFAKGGIKNHT